MKYWMLCFIFVVVSAFAQEPESENTLDSEQEQVAESETERTAEGYRIVRIKTEDIPAIKDGMAQAKAEAEQKIQEEEMEKPVIPFKFSLGVSAGLFDKFISAKIDAYADDEYYDLLEGISLRYGISALIPLSRNAVALKLGVFYESIGLESVEPFYLKDGTYIYPESEYEESRIAVPAVIVIKGDHSTLLFEIGFQVGFPVSSELENSSDFSSEDHDLLELGYRKSFDFELLMGLGKMLGYGFTIEGYLDLQCNSPYDDSWALYTRSTSAISLSLVLTYFFL